MEEAPKPLAPGTPVRVWVQPSEPHCRTPHYLRGAVGEVQSVAGRYRNPSQLAYHRPGLPMKTLYRVRFPQTAVWADYQGPAGDSLVADLYEHWLEPLAQGETRP